MIIIDITNCTQMDGHVFENDLSLATQRDN